MTWLFLQADEFVAHLKSELSSPDRELILVVDSEASRTGSWRKEEEKPR